jgi:hypothetical protein
MVNIPNLHYDSKYDAGSNGHDAGSNEHDAGSTGYDAESTRYNYHELYEESSNEEPKFGLDEEDQIPDIYSENAFQDNDDYDGVHRYINIPQPKLHRSDSSELFYNSPKKEVNLKILKAHKKMFEESLNNEQLHDYLSRYNYEKKIYKETIQLNYNVHDKYYEGKEFEEKWPAINDEHFQHINHDNSDRIGFNAHEFHTNRWNHINANRWNHNLTPNMQVPNDDTAVQESIRQYNEHLLEMMNARNINIAKLIEESTLVEIEATEEMYERSNNLPENDNLPEYVWNMILHINDPPCQELVVYSQPGYDAPPIYPQPGDDAVAPGDDAVAPGYPQLINDTPPVYPQPINDAVGDDTVAPPSYSLPIYNGIA